MTRPAHGMRRIRRHDLAGHQPVEQHTDAGQMLLHRRRGAFTAQLLDIGGDIHRLHVAQLLDAAIFAPAQEGPSFARVGFTCVRIADIDGEEFEEPAHGGLACSFDKYGERRPVF
jgi:hypothetical protein